MTNYESQYQTFPSLLCVLSLAVLAHGNFTLNLKCPSNCRCNDDPRTNLVVDCHGSPDADRELLSQQLESLLSSALIYCQLKSLSIVNSPLTDVPRSVCRLTTLTQLHLNNNQLNRLPDNCFPHLKRLTYRTASGSKIQKLQDGLFDGLQELVSLNFRENHISNIGLRVFSNESDTINLRHVDLSHNHLTNVEPWPLVRGQLGTEQSAVTIRLDNNRISTFTNEMQWKINCSVDPGFLNLDLSQNEIRHIMNVAKGWSFMPLSELFCLIRFRLGGSPSVRIKFSARSYACDCIDYPFYAISAKFPFNGLLQDCHCNPNYSPFYYTKVTEIPLNQFVCRMTERCPPGCRCVYRPANATLHAYCSNANLSSLPLELPKLPNTYTKYKLDFSNNRLLRRLERRPYFVNTSILDISNCGVDSIPLTVWKDVSTMEKVAMDGNLLKSPSSGVVTLPLTAKISLVRNPWACSCENRWMSRWLRSVSHRLTNVDAVMCGSPDRLRGKNIVKISDEEFCTDPVSAERKRVVTTAASTVAGVVICLLILLSVAVIIYRQKINLYTRFKFHPFDRDECDGEDMFFDVFLSCCSDDNLPHGNEIRERLEHHGYRVCYPPRDFLAGLPICENIHNAIVHSKRTVCLLTTRFLQRLDHLLVY